MNGFVDEELRALLEVRVSAVGHGSKRPLQVWIDTAFNGGLVIPWQQIESLRLKKASSTGAILADGRIVDVETYSCFLEWFGREYQTQVIANDGQIPLLGTMLLAGRNLSIDYAQKTVSLD